MDDQALLDTLASTAGPAQSGLRTATTATSTATTTTIQQTFEVKTDQSVLMTDDEVTKVLSTSVLKFVLYFEIQSGLSI